MSESLAVTYDVLRREIGRFLGLENGRDPSQWTAGSDDSTDVDDILRSGMRRVLNPPPLPNEKYSHEWSFLRPVATLTTSAPYTTGTVEIVSGVATITGGSWPSWSTQCLLNVAHGTYAVESVDGTELTLKDTTVNVAAGASFVLCRMAYDLPTDFAMIEGPLIFATGQSLLRGEIPRVAEYQVMNDLNSATLHGSPRIYAIRPKAIDMTTSTTYELLLSPASDAAYSLHYHYRVAIPALDSANGVPPGGEAHGELYLEACLAAAEQKLQDTMGLHTQRFMECLAASVSHDRRVSCPDTLGFNRDRSDGFDPDDHFYTNTGLTRYKGIYPS